MTVKRSRPTGETLGGSNGTRACPSCGFQISLQEQERTTHPLEEITPNIDGSDQQCVLNGTQTSTKSSWGTLLRYAFKLIVVLALVTTLHYGNIARQRRQWAQEIKGYEQIRATHEKEMRELVVKKEKLVAEKAELEKWSERLKKRRKQIKWTNFTNVGCSAYATKRYTALLSNVAPGLNPGKECRDKALSVNGKRMVPTKCKEEMTCGKMMGIWNVASTQCMPRVTKHTDEGCYRPGGRHFKGIITNVLPNEDFLKICYTMPGGVVHTNDGRPLSHGEPEYCHSDCGTVKQLLTGKCSYWARWNVVDLTCS